MTFKISHKGQAGIGKRSNWGRGEEVTQLLSEAGRNWSWSRNRRKEVWSEGEREEWGKTGGGETPTLKPSLWQPQDAEWRSSGPPRSLHLPLGKIWSLSAKEKSTMQGSRICCRQHLSWGMLTLCNPDSLQAQTLPGLSLQKIQAFPQKKISVSRPQKARPPCPRSCSTRWQTPSGRLGNLKHTLLKLSVDLRSGSQLHSPLRRDRRISYTQAPLGPGWGGGGAGWEG